jgi:hypothetical protein
MRVRRIALSDRPVALWLVAHECSLGRIARPEFSALLMSDLEAVEKYKVDIASLVFIEAPRRTYR